MHANLRVLSANDQQGDSILTAFVSTSFPTRTNHNGQPKAVITPTLAYGKGWSVFDMQGTTGVSDPAASTSLIGRTYRWNHAVRVHAASRLWPELEINRNWFSGGKNDGRSQTFLTPGVVIGRTPITERV